MTEAFWQHFWKYAITGFVVVVLSLIGSCQTTNYQIRKSIEAGADLIIASCALSGNDGQGLCMAATVQRSK